MMFEANKHGGSVVSSPAALRRSVSVVPVIAALLAAAPALAQEVDDRPQGELPPDMRSGIVDDDRGQAAQPRGLTDEGKLRQPLGAEQWEQVEELTNPGETPGRDDVEAGEGPRAIPPGPVQSVVRPEPLEPATPPTMPEPRDFAEETSPPAEPMQDTLPPGQPLQNDPALPPIVEEQAED